MLRVHNRNVVEINLNTIGNNIDNIVSHYDDYDYYIGVVKGNAYGHDFGVVPTLIKNGINYLGVATMEEAIAVRNIDNDVPVLIMEPIEFSELEIASVKKLTITISSYSYFEELREIILESNWKLKAHIKLDTGLNRLGIDDKAKFEEVFYALQEWDGFELEGLFTHFATTGVNDSLFDQQVEKFLFLTSDIDLEQVPIIHLGRSATIETRSKLPFANGIRLGAIMYGINQTFRPYLGFKGKMRKIRDDYRRKKLKISPTFTENKISVSTAFALKSPVMEVNKLYAGESVGYGGTFTTTKDTYVAVCPIGYADGLHLSLRNSHAAIGKKLYPIVGIINMCMITIEVDTDVKVGDMLTIMGDAVSLKRNAQITNTTPYVGMTQVNPNIKRVYIESEEITNG